MILVLQGCVSLFGNEEGWPCHPDHTALIVNSDFGMQVNQTASNPQLCVAANRDATRDWTLGPEAIDEGLVDASFTRPAMVIDRAREVEIGTQFSQIHHLFGSNAEEEVSAVHSLADLYVGSALGQGRVVVRQEAPGQRVPTVDDSDEDIDHAVLVECQGCSVDVPVAPDLLALQVEGGSLQLCVGEHTEVFGTVSNSSILLYAVGEAQSSSMDDFVLRTCSDVGPGSSDCAVGDDPDFSCSARDPWLMRGDVEDTDPEPEEPQ